jgi:acetyl-CoA acetyltransferase
MTSSSLNDKAFIAGVGATPQGKLPGRSGDDLAVWALRLALADSGLQLSDIDGLAVMRSYGGAGDIWALGPRLGIEPHMSWNVNYQGEGLQTAVMAIALGLCRCVALLYGTNQRTNRNTFGMTTYHGGSNFEQVYGLANPGATAAFNYRRRMHDFGATEEQLGAVAIAQSKAAALNPLAVYRDALTIEEYLAMPYVIAPLRLCDFSMVSDGGFATILVSEDLAAEIGPRAIAIGAMGSSSNFRELADPRAMYHPSQVPNAQRLWGSCDYTPTDVDVLYVQDAYTPNVLSALENYGFCEFGTAHEWIQDGRIELDGELPVNVNGGQNRMTYMVGWHNTFDSVTQLRGEADTPERQVSDCHVALCTMSAGHWAQTCSMLLHTA